LAESHVHFPSNNEYTEYIKPVSVLLSVLVENEISAVGRVTRVSLCTVLCMERRLCWGC